MFKAISAFRFSEKAVQMKLTIRTPYREYLVDHVGFQRMFFKSQQGVVAVQNRTPGATYVLEPGPLKVKLTHPVEGCSGDWMHTGAFVVVNKDNTCEVNAFDLVDRNVVQADKFEKNEFKDEDSLAGKYIKRMRGQTARFFRKKVTQA